MSNMLCMFLFFYQFIEFIKVICMEVFFYIHDASFFLHFQPFPLLLLWVHPGGVYLVYVEQMPIHLCVVLYFLCVPYISCC
jgi:hypothetical protein